MKKYLTIIMTILTVLTAASCGQVSDSDVTKADELVTEASTTTTAESVSIDTAESSETGEIDSSSADESSAADESVSIDTAESSEADDSSSKAETTAVTATKAQTTTTKTQTTTAAATTTKATSKAAAANTTVRSNANNGSNSNNGGGQAVNNGGNSNNNGNTNNNNVGNTTKQTTATTTKQTTTTTTTTKQTTTTTQQTTTTTTTTTTTPAPEPEPEPEPQSVSIDTAGLDDVLTAYLHLGHADKMTPEQWELVRSDICNYGLETYNGQTTFVDDGYEFSFVEPLRLSVNTDWTDFSHAHLDVSSDINNENSWFGYKARIDNAQSNDELHQVALKIQNSERGLVLWGIESWYHFCDVNGGFDDELAYLNSDLVFNIGLMDDGYMWFLTE